MLTASYKKVLICVFVLSLFFESKAQDILWAEKILNVSSEYSSREYSSDQILNEPDAMWLGNKKSNMWRPKSSDKESFIMVSFGQSIKANQLLIAEGENPGAIVKIIAYDVNLAEFALAEMAPEDVDERSRFLHIEFSETEFEIYAIRLVLDGESVHGYNGIDAIGIANNDSPIIAKVNISEDELDHPNFKIRRLGDHINSQYVEHNPILSLDRKTLYFSRQFDPNNVGGAEDPEDIWYSEWDANVNDWGQAINIGSPWNTSGPNFIASIAEVDGQEIFVLGNRYEAGKMITGVSWATRERNFLSNPEPIEIEGDYNYSDHVDYFLVPGGKTLLMSSERDDSFGKRDLYVIFKEGDGWTFGEPVHLGIDINTFEEEESPFMTHDTKTMYFSSSGYKGYGGVDIYQSHRLDETWTKWSAPLNIGVKINGYGDDEYLSVSENEEHLFYTRTEGQDHSDIYDVELFKKPILDRKPTQLDVKSNVVDNNEATEPSEDLYEKLNTVHSGDSLQMSHVYFDLNSSYLNAKSEPELVELASFLISRADLKIELSAHTDSRHTHKYNQWMSERRAKRVADHLIKLGVGADQITTFGYGETRPLNECRNGVKCSEEEHQSNRRVEVKFL